MNFKDLLRSIIQISNKAGNKIIDIYNSPANSLKVDYKSDSSPLTIADKASNKIIIDGLEKLNRNIPILSEEEKEINFKLRKKWDIFWLVDPLDGTKEFIKRNGEFTVNIALIKNGNPIMGVVYAPVLKKTWYGLVNHGSYLIHKNDKPKKINALDKKDGTTKIVSSRSHSNNPRLEKFIQEFKEYELVKMGSSIKMCLVADGSAHYYPRFGPTMEWDTGAAHAVVKYAGANIYNLNTGEELIYNKENLLNPEFIVK